MHHGLAQAACGARRTSFGLLAGTVGYYFGNAGLTVLRQGDNRRKISDLALTTTSGLVEAVLSSLATG